MKKQVKKEIKGLRLFLFGVSTVIPIPFTLLPGTIYVFEFLAPVYLFFQMSRRRKSDTLFVPSQLRNLIFLLFLWMASSLITDSLRNVEFLSQFKGFALIFFTLLNLTCIWVLTQGSLLNLSYIFLGRALTTILYIVLSPNYYQSVDPWKWGIGGSVTLLLILLTIAVGKKIWIVLLLFFVGCYSVFIGARSLSAFTIASVVIYLLLGSKRNLRSNIPKLLLAGALTYTFSVFALENLASESVKSRSSLQNSGDLGILFGGRPEIFFSIEQIRQNPFVGIGSYNSNSITNFESSLQTIQSLGYELDYSGLVRKGLPTHSSLFSAWIYNGIGGAFFWCYSIIIASLALINKKITGNRFYLLIVYLCLSLLWSIFFSPFGASARIETALSLVAIVIANQALQFFSESKKSNRHRAGT